MDEEERKTVQEEEQEKTRYINVRTNGTHFNMKRFRISIKLQPYFRCVNTNKTVYLLRMHFADTFCQSRKQINPKYASNLSISIFCLKQLSQAVTFEV